MRRLVDLRVALRQYSSTAGWPRSRLSLLSSRLMRSAFTVRSSFAAQCSHLYRWFELLPLKADTTIELEQNSDRFKVSVDYFETLHNKQFWKKNCLFSFVGKTDHITPWVISTIYCWDACGWRSRCICAPVACWMWSIAIGTVLWQDDRQLEGAKALLWQEDCAVFIITDDEFFLKSNFFFFTIRVNQRSIMFS